MIHIQPFTGILPNIEMISAPDSFFGQVKEQYQSLARAGYFHQEATKSLYVYRIESLHGVHVGLLAALPVTDYLAGNILKHEQTLAAKEEKTAKLVLERGAMIKPVVLAHRPSKAIHHLLYNSMEAKPPVLHIALKGGKHSFWKIDDEAAIHTLQVAFTEKIPQVYIADGHHRVASAAEVYQKTGKHEFILAALFASSELKIWDYNRVVEGLFNQTPLSFMAHLSEVCHISPLPKLAAPTQKNEFAMHLDGQWFGLRWRNDIIAQQNTIAERLDATMLNQYILKPLLGIADIRTDLRVSYIEGVKGLEILAQRNRIPTVSFALFPVSPDDFFSLADGRQTMPPKSTWFEPRIKNGFISMEI